MVFREVANHSSQKLPKILNKKTSLLKGNWYSGDLPSDDAEAKEDI